MTSNDFTVVTEPQQREFIRTISSLNDSQKIDEYLKRIGLDSSLLINNISSDQLLSKLIFCHLINIPFENFSMHRHKPILLHRNYLFDKIIVKRQGGFCFELNGLFGWLLENVSKHFKVSYLHASVNLSQDKDEEGRYSDDGHLALVVQLNEQKIYLVDVGFGPSQLDKLLYEYNFEQTLCDGFKYRIMNGANSDLDYDYLQYFCKSKSTWTNRYRWKLTEKQDSFDYNNYLPGLSRVLKVGATFSHCPLVIIVRTDNRLVTLINRKYSVTTRPDGHKQLQRNVSGDEQVKLYKSEFGIELNDEYEADGSWKLQMEESDYRPFSLNEIESYHRIYENILENAN
ncbi:unnamed protein product [Didymodactylos carnosus]|uniref:arylamine N-acetyltransferase n=1 Tax=Didymodactylos carnosus TaxID=1234261 RepID=A0A814IJN2_9BILA|nr:unnamed protein product [Didymodactylos carnosus]CAF3795712.1 unnamed protein product [Didymodactylos carnosus]